MRTMLRPAALAMLALLSIACADRLPTAPHAPASLARFTETEAASDLWRDRITGVTEDGALYALYRPVDWNGDVVYYAHGIIDPALPIALPTNDDAEEIRDGLGAMGYAVAYSSFSENGYAFADAVAQTRRLRALVVQTIGPPRRSFLIGHSLGAQAVQAIAEHSRSSYDGALALCGVLGGTKRQVQYIGDIRTLFDFMYPNWFPGTDVMSTPVVSPNEVVQRAMAAMNGDGFQGFGRLARMDQGTLAGRNTNEQVTTLLNVLGYHVRGVNDFLARTNGEILYTTPAFTSPVLPQAYVSFVNATIPKFTATPGAELWMADNYEPTGRLHIPMLTLHKRHDRLVPFDHEERYRAAVASAGRSELLRQTTIEDYGHCEFGAARTLAAFQELEAWASTFPRSRGGEPVAASLD